MKRAAKILKITGLVFLILIAIVFIVYGYKDKPVNELKEKYAAPPSAFCVRTGSLPLSISKHI